MAATRPGRLPWSAWSAGTRGRGWFGQGDLALRLLAKDTAAARAEVESLTGARTCTITLIHHQGTVRLEIVNDGAQPPSAAGFTGAADLTRTPPLLTPSGIGLSGLAERTRAASGTWLTTAHDGLFLLSVEVPEEVA